MSDPRNSSASDRQTKPGGATPDGSPYRPEPGQPPRTNPIKPEPPGLAPGIKPAAPPHPDAEREF